MHQLRCWPVLVLFWHDCLHFVCIIFDSHWGIELQFVRIGPICICGNNIRGSMCLVRCWAVLGWYRIGVMHDVCRRKICCCGGLSLLGLRCQLLFKRRCAGLLKMCRGRLLIIKDVGMFELLGWYICHCGGHGMLPMRSWEVWKTGSIGMSHVRGGHLLETRRFKLHGVHCGLVWWHGGCHHFFCLLIVCGWQVWSCGSFGL